ncbi:unnamed protein product, partial [Effrenium voratum]
MDAGGKATIYDRLVRHWRMIKLKEQHQVMLQGQAEQAHPEPQMQIQKMKDLEFLEAYDDSWEFDQMTEDIKPSKEEAESLYFPGGAYEPELSADALQDVDNLADREQFHLMSMDVRDAYLTCAQKHKTVVTLEVD